MQKPQKEMVSLSSYNPELASEWHPTKNGSLKPTMVSRGSKRKVWWIGKCGHEWEAEIYSRASGRGCPYCSGKRVLEGFNDLASQVPNLVTEWDFEKNGILKPNTVTVGSHKEIWWKCSICGYEWKATVKSRVNGTRCPACYRRNRTSFPEQALFYYVHVCYPDAISGFSELFDNSMELDVFIPSLKISPSKGLIHFSLNRFLVLMHPTCKNAPRPSCGVHWYQN